MLTQREKDILNILSHNDFCQAKQIASIIKVSEKTVRNDILSINSKLENIAFISSKQNYGYKLEIVSEEDYLEALKESETKIPSSPEKRIEFIIKLFLKENRYIKTEEIANMLYQSNSTISTDLKEVRKNLRKYHLSLETRPKYGMILKGEEKDLRELERDLFYEKEGLLESRNREIIAGILRDVLRAYDFQMVEFAFDNLVVHLQVAIDRIEKGKTVDFPENYYLELKDKTEYTIAKEIVLIIEKTFNIKIEEGECVYISMHLLGKKFQNEKSNTVIPQEYTMLIQKLLDDLSQEYKLSFSSDLNLQLALTLHLIPLSYRLKYDLRMENPLLDSIKNNYSHAYIIAKSLANGLAKAFKKELSEDEVAYLALHINLSMEKEYDKYRKKNIILVCATGKGTAKLLEYQYSQKFSNWINELICCDVISLKNQDFSNIDFIITTVPIKDSVPVPVIETGFILDRNETEKIEKDIVKMNPLEKYFPRELFFRNLEIKTQKEVISFLVDNISKVYCLPQAFEELVWKREEIFSTAFNNEVALPHPYRLCTEDTFAAVAILKNPIDWNGQAVKIVFLISLAKDSDDNIQDFYGRLSKILVNDTLIKEIYKNPDYDFFMNTLNQINL